MADAVALTFPESLVEAAVPDELPEAAFVRLVLHCVALAVPLTVAAAWAHAEHLQRPNSTLSANLWSWFAFLHAAPQPVCTALRCQRPDMLHAVQRLYGGWLARCRSPRLISDVLEHLVASTWHVASGSKACRVLTGLVASAQVAAVPAKSTADADIVVDERDGLLISERDKCFLALVLACGPSRELARSDIKAFREAASSTPRAFEELSEGAHPLDELILEESL